MKQIDDAITALEAAKQAVSITTSLADILNALNNQTFVLERIANSQERTEKAVVKNQAPKPAKEEAAPKPAKEEAAPKPAKEEAAPKPAKEEAAPKPAKEEAAPKPAKEEAAPKPAKKKRSKRRTKAEIKVDQAVAAYDDVKDGDNKTLVLELFDELNLALSELPESHPRYKKYFNPNAKSQELLDNQLKRLKNTIKVMNKKFPPSDIASVVGKYGMTLTHVNESDYDALEVELYSLNNNYDDAPKPPAKEEAAPKPPAKEEVAPKPPAKEEAAPKPPAKEEAAPKPPAKEEAAPKPTIDGESLLSRSHEIAALGYPMEALEALDKWDGQAQNIPETDYAEADAILSALEAKYRK